MRILLFFSLVNKYAPAEEVNWNTLQSCLTLEVKTSRNNCEETHLLASEVVCYRAATFLRLKSFRCIFSRIFNEKNWGFFRYWTVKWQNSEADNSYFGVTLFEYCLCLIQNIDNRCFFNIIMKVYYHLHDITHEIFL